MHYCIGIGGTCLPVLAQNRHKRTGFRGISRRSGDSEVQKQIVNLEWLVGKSSSFCTFLVVFLGKPASFDFSMAMVSPSKAVTDKTHQSPITAAVL